MKNCSVRIMLAQKIASPPFHMQGFSMNSLRIDLKLLIAINSLMSSISSSLSQSTINRRCSTCPSSRRIWPKLSVTFIFRQSNWFRAIHQYICSKHLCTIFTSVVSWHFFRVRGKGTRSGRTARFKPQRDWVSFVHYGNYSQKLRGTHFSTHRRDHLKTREDRDREMHTERKDSRSICLWTTVASRRGRPGKNMEVTKAEATGTNEETPSQQLK
jgi:hypothetical protein